MPFTGDFELEGKKYKLQNSQYTVHRTTDYTGKPTDKLSGGSLRLTLELEDEGTEVFDWLVSQEVKDGTVNIYQGAGAANQLLKKISFTQGFVTSFSETFVDNGNLMVDVDIHANKIKIGESNEHDNKWPSHVTG